MKTHVEKIKILEKATITINLETEDEIRAFKNVLFSGENGIYSASHGYDFKLEKKIVQELKDAIS